MNRRIQFSMAVVLLAALACSNLSPTSNRVIGSGHVTGETRQVPDFSSVELAGSADVNILVADAQSVNVESDDNIVPLIDTRVVAGRLIISTKPNVSFSTSSRAVVTVAMRSLERITLSGSGHLNVGDMAGPSLTVELPGSGDITVEGVADRLTISLPGSGNIQCNGLKARSARVTLTGSGTIALYASESVNAGLAGSGAIRYDGSPAQVTKSITGSGSITP